MWFESLVAIYARLILVLLVCPYFYRSHWLLANDANCLIPRKNGIKLWLIGRISVNIQRTQWPQCIFSGVLIRSSYYKASLFSAFYDQHTLKIDCQFSCFVLHQILVFLFHVFLRIFLFVSTNVFDLSLVIQKEKEMKRFMP